MDYAKIAEYQARGLVHFHAVIRIDGPSGPGDLPPEWADTRTLEQATRAAAGKTTITIADPREPGHQFVLRWGKQLDIRPVYLSGTHNGDALADAQVPDTSPSTPQREPKSPAPQTGQSEARTTSP